MTHRSHRFVRPLLGLAVWMISEVVSLTQDFAVDPIGFLTLAGESSGGGFAVRGSWSPVDDRGMTRGEFAIQGALRTVLSPEAPSLTPESVVVNGSFEEVTTAFIPDAQGIMALSPAVSGANLLPYGDAEGLVATDGSVGVAIPGWSTEGPMSVITWVTQDNWLTPTSPGPPDRGLNLFYGGIENPMTTAKTRLDLPVDAALIDAGAVRAQLSGWFGGFLGQGDTASLGLRFLNAAGADLGAFLIGAVTPTQRALTTGLVYDSATRTVPPGARKAEVILEMRREAGIGWNDGIADNLSLVLFAARPSAMPGWSVIGSEVHWISNPNALGVQSPQGGKFLDLTGARDFQPYGGVAQILSTVPHQTYRVSFWLGTRQDVPAFRGPVTVDVEVMGAIHTVRWDPEGPGNQWKEFSFNFTADSATTRIAFVGGSSGGGALIGLDQVAVVPITSEEEPVLVVSLPVGPEPPAALELSFPSVGGQRYFIEALADIASGNWNLLPETERTGTGARISVLAPIRVGAGAQFFRLRVGR
ncbi:MAG: DUF642 domain-containing protein [Verrucomicrobiales bacterium]|nr:DUF642 domain-containing protein [Verrucomicrobiales bacterium]